MLPASGFTHRLLVADELGVLRRVDKQDKSDWSACTVQAFDGEMDKRQGIECLAAIECEPQALLAAGRASGEVSIHGAADAALQQRIAPEASTSGKDAAVVHVAWLRRHDAALPGLVACHRSGLVRTFTSPADAQWTQSNVFAAPSTILCAAVSPDEQLLALGCQGCELRTVSLQTGAVVHQVKSGRPNPQTRLIDKPWVSCVAWLPGAPGQRVVTGTGHHKVRVYDVGAQKRPLFEADWLDARITAVAPQADGNSVWVANAKGFIQVLDLRTQRFMGALKGQIAGSVRSLCLHPTQPLIASVGLDRWLRVHDTTSRKLLLRTYLKSQLSACAWVAGAEPSASGRDEEGEGAPAAVDGAAPVVAEGGRSREGGPAGGGVSVNEQAGARKKRKRAKTGEGAGGD